MDGFIHMGVDVRQFCSSAAQTYKNYKKIGNIVGEKQAKEWWFKNITGLRPLGRASTAKKWTTRFKNPLLFLPIVHEMVTFDLSDYS